VGVASGHDNRGCPYDELRAGKLLPQGEMPEKYLWERLLASISIIESIFS
jgi:hypothetical protein